MAGGPFAEHIICMSCVLEGVVTRAERLREGQETDQYECLEGHRFGVDWSRGAPTSSQWPPPSDEVAAIEGMRKHSAPRTLVADTAVRRFVHGAALSPAGALLVWLEARRIEGGFRRLRLPVVLVRGEAGFSLHDVRIGSGPDALAILCDDCALGVGLADRARQACGDVATCALWLDGYWRGGEERVFAVVKVGAPISAEALAAAAAEVEDPPGTD